MINRQTLNFKKWTIILIDCGLEGCNVFEFGLEDEP